MEWMHLFDNYDAWYRYIRNHIFQGEHYCAYEDCSEKDCYMLVEIYQSEIDSLSEYLHAWSYSIVNCRVKIDLLSHRLFTIKSMRVMKEEFDKSKNSRVITDNDLKVKRV